MGTDNRTYAERAVDVVALHRSCQEDLILTVESILNFLQPAVMEEPEDE